MGRLLRVFLGVAIVGLAPTLPALPVEDFSLVYTVDDATGSVVLSQTGVYGAAIACHGDWAYSNLLPGGSASGGIGPRVLRYGVSLSGGTLRVTESRGGVALHDDLLSCASFSLDAGPRAQPPTGVVTHEMRASATQGACGATATAGAPGVAPMDYSVRAPHSDAFPLGAGQSGMCFALSYVGMVPPSPAVCAAWGWSACVPFSGRLAGDAAADSASTPAQDVRLSGKACSFLVVGGYCWSGAATGDAGAGTNATPLWSPFAGTGRIALAVDTPVNGEVRPAAGSWAAFTYAPGV